MSDEKLQLGHWGDSPGFMAPEVNGFLVPECTAVWQHRDPGQHLPL